MDYRSFVNGNQNLLGPKTIIDGKVFAFVCPPISGLFIKKR